MMMEAIECLNYKHIGKGALEAYVHIYVPKWGIEIYGIQIYQKDGRRWISFPAKEYEKDGEKKYFPYMRFKMKELMPEFTKKVLHAVDEFYNEKKDRDSSTLPSGWS